MKIPENPHSLSQRRSKIELEKNIEEKEKNLKMYRSYLKCSDIH